MRNLVAALVVLGLSACGGEPAELPEVADAGGLVVDAGPVDAGPPDYCDTLDALELCGAAVANVASICREVDGYTSRGGRAFCYYVEGNTGAPDSACKNIAGMSPAQVIAFGLCY